MNNTVTLTAEEIKFLQELFDSNLAVTLHAVEVAAGLRVKIRGLGGPTPNPVPSI